MQVSELLSPLPGNGETKNATDLVETIRILDCRKCDWQLLYEEWDEHKENIGTPSEPKHNLRSDSREFCPASEIEAQTTQSPASAILVKRRGR